MRTHLRVAAAALIFVGLATGCSRTTAGAVAMTTEPGPPIASPRTPSTDDPGFPSIPGLPDITSRVCPQIPGFPMPGNTDVPEVPAPANAQTMKCSEYTKLDEATQRAVIRAILAEQREQQRARVRDGRGDHGDDHVRVSAERRRERGGARRVAAVSG